MDEHLTEDEREKLREIIKSWDSAQLGISTFRAIGNFIKWLAAVLAAGAILWAVMTGGRPH